MTRTSKYTTWGLLATLAATVAAPVLADPAGQQKNKNNWRNLGIAGAAIAGYGILNHNNTATVLGAAGAAYSASRYEKDRHNQSQDNTNRYDFRRYHRSDNNGGYYNSNGNYDNNGRQWRSDYNSSRDYNNSGYNNSGYNNNGYNNRDENNGYGGDCYGDDRDNNGTYNDGRARHDNGKHRGWAKHHDRD